MHNEQAKLVNVQSHMYKGTRENSHVICAQTNTIKLFRDFSILWVFEFFNTLKTKTCKVRSTKTSKKQT